MKNHLLLSFLIGLSLFLFSCQSRYLPKKHTDFPDADNTESKAIQYQIKKEYTINGVTADNRFDGARLNHFEMIDDSTFRATISPENEPINPSPHFAFLLSSDKPKNICLELYYISCDHRYWPKLSYDGENWFPIDSMDFDTLKAGNIATLHLELDERELFVCAQEIHNSAKVRAWADNLSRKDHVNFEIIGKSKLDRDMIHLDIYHDERKKKDAIIIMSRLHPPEISGYIAMQAFIEQIMDDNSLSNAFRRKFRILVYPLLNPDGVDLGHWRHNAGGIDLNRDWANYIQDEVRVVANHIVRTIKKDRNNVILGLDFHSTQEDVYYTLTKNRQSKIFNFKDYWIYGIDRAIPDYTPDDQPFDLNQAITKGWFYLEFNAEGITYEVGDETPREFVTKKAKIAAEEMMKLLILR